MREKIQNQTEKSELQIHNEVKSLIKNPKDLKDELQEAFDKLTSLGDHVDVLQKSLENSPENHSDPMNIENSVVGQSENSYENHFSQEALFCLYLDWLWPFLEFIKKNRVRWNFDKVF